ncbi:hypothetical protein ACHAWF_007674 [Thalassiosira exigua]
MMMIRHSLLLFLPELRTGCCRRRRFGATTLSSRAAASDGDGDRGKRIMIFASEVPVVAKLNRFQKVEDVFYKVWERTDADQLRRRQRELLVPTPEEQLAAVIEEAGVKEMAERAIERSSAADTSAEVNEASKDLAQSIEKLSDVKEEVKTELVQHFQSELQKGYGKKSEAKAIGHYEAKEKVSVRDNNLKFYKKTVGTVGDDTEVLVGGRIDGTVGAKVIEVKNRMRKFFDPLPPYDLAQLQTYLYILESPEGEMVEHLRTKKGLETKSTVVPRDEEMFDGRLRPALLDFADCLRRFMDDGELQKRFLLAEDQDAKLEIMKEAISEAQ